MKHLLIATIVAVLLVGRECERKFVALKFIFLATNFAVEDLPDPAKPSIAIIILFNPPLSKSLII